MAKNEFERFVIIAYGRTRSTLLSKLLNNHPHIGCEEEIFLGHYFNEGRAPIIARLLGKKKAGANDLNELHQFRQQDPIGFMDHFYSLMAKHKHHVGFKIFPEQNLEALDHILKNREIKKILLVRNFLFSHVSVKQSMASDSWFTRKGEKNELPKIEFQKKRFFKYLQKRVNTLHQIVNELNKTGQEYFLCFSEDIGKEDWWKDIYKFLGVSLNIRTESDLVKQNSDFLELRVSNYPEMVRQLMYTDYYYLLYGDFFPDREHWLPPEITEDMSESHRGPNEIHSLKEMVSLLQKDKNELKNMISKLKSDYMKIENSQSYKLGYRLTRIPAIFLPSYKRK